MIIKLNLIKYYIIFSFFLFVGFSVQAQKWDKKELLVPETQIYRVELDGQCGLVDGKDKIIVPLGEYNGFGRPDILGKKGFYKEPFIYIGKTESIDNSNWHVKGILNLSGKLIIPPIYSFIQFEKYYYWCRREIGYGDEREHIVSLRDLNGEEFFNIENATFYHNDDKTKIFVFWLLSENHYIGKEYLKLKNSKKGFYFDEDIVISELRSLDYGNKISFSLENKSKRKISNLICVIEIEETDKNLNRKIKYKKKHSVNISLDVGEVETYTIRLNNQVEIREESWDINIEVLDIK